MRKSTTVLSAPLDGPAWNGHLYVEPVDVSRTRAHLELVVEPRSSVGQRVEPAGSSDARPRPGLSRMQDVAVQPLPTMEEHDEDGIIVIPAVTP